MGRAQTAPVDHYVIWFDLQPGADDLSFVAALDGWLGWLRAEGRIDGWHLWRRKLGLGPEGLGEFHLDIRTTDLSQLDRAFETAAARQGEAEDRHAAVYRQVANVRFGLYRDFPDPVRAPGPASPPAFPPASPTPGRGGPSGITPT